MLVACLAATWLIWGSTYLAIKIALQGLPPFVQMGSRFLLAGGLLLGWATWRGAALPTVRQWTHALLLGALMLAGGMGGTAYAEQTVGSGLVVAFIAIIPVMIALLSTFAGQVPGRAEWLGIAVGTAGVLLLARGAGFQSSPVGLAAITIACATWSVGSVLSLHRLTVAPGATGFASQMIGGGLVLVALAAATGELPAVVERWPPPPAAVAAWLYLVGPGSLLAFNAYLVLLARAGPSLASSYCYVNPLIAMGLATAIGGERIAAGEWIAAGLVLSGVLLVLAGAGPRYGRRRPPFPEPADVAAAATRPGGPRR